MPHHYKTLIKLGTPIVIGQIGNLVLNFADTLMIGHHSTMELAAASFVNGIFVLFILFSIGFNFALTPVAGPFVGRNEKEEAGVVMRSCLWANVILAISLTALAVAFYFSLPLFGQPDELLPLMRPYLIVNIISLPFAVLGCQMKQFFDTIGSTKISMYVLVFSNILNIIGNYCLIYGNAGMPELGLLGAGISTATSRFVILMLFCLIFFMNKRYSVYLNGALKAEPTKTKRTFVKINQLGWTSAIQSTIECGAFSLVAIFVGWLGTKPLAAHQIMLTVSMFFYNIYLGIATAISIRVSHFAGMKEWRAIVDVTKSGFFIIIAIAAFMAVPVYTFRYDIGSLFSDDPLVGQLVALTVIPLILYQISDALQCSIANALRGLGEMRLLMWAAFFAYFVVSLPLSWLLGIQFGFGLVGIWSAFPVCLTVAGVLYFIILKVKLPR